MLIGYCIYLQGVGFELQSSTYPSLKNKIYSHLSKKKCILIEKKKKCILKN
jgi:hypothetical protein